MTLSYKCTIFVLQAHHCSSVPKPSPLNVADALFKLRVVASWHVSYISEGSISHINGVWPSFLTYIRESELLCSIAIYGIKSHALLCYVQWEWSDKNIKTQSNPDTSAFFLTPL